MELPPALLASYDVSRVLGRGSYSTVLLAVEKKSRNATSSSHPATATECAVKAVSKARLFTKEEKEIPAREIETLQALAAHPNVVKLLSFFEDAENVFIVLERVRLGSLKDKLASGKYPYGLDERIVRPIMRQLLSALAFMHDEKGLVHCDISTANILIDEGGVIKLCDFGMVLKNPSSSNTNSASTTIERDRSNTLSMEDADLVKVNNTGAKPNTQQQTTTSMIEILDPDVLLADNSYAWPSSSSSTASPSSSVTHLGAKSSPQPPLGKGRSLSTASSFWSKGSGARTASASDFNVSYGSAAESETQVNPWSSSSSSSYTSASSAPPMELASTATTTTTTTSSSSATRSFSYTTMTLRGTIGYAPPVETLDGGAKGIPPPIDSSFDMWSAGMVAYECLTGVPPTSVLLFSVTSPVMDVGFPDSVWRHRTPGSKDFVNRLLRKDPKQRLRARAALTHEWIVNGDR